MTDREITRIVNRYIGVSGGYLVDFSYRSHASSTTLRVNEVRPRPTQHAGNRGTAASCQ
jgi:hypothetical protein